MDDAYHFPSRRWRLILFFQHVVVLCGVGLLLVFSFDAFRSLNALPEGQPIHDLAAYLQLSNPFIYIAVAVVGGLTAWLTSALRYHRLSYRIDGRSMTVRLHQLAAAQELLVRQSDIQRCELRPDLPERFFGLVTVVITTWEDKQIAIPGLRTRTAVRLVSHLRSGQGRMTELATHS